jgi:hypothetical protein
VGGCALSSGCAVHAQDTFRQACVAVAGGKNGMHATQRVYRRIKKEKMVSQDLPPVTKPCCWHLPHNRIWLNPTTNGATTSHAQPTTGPGPVFVLPGGYLGDGTKLHKDFWRDFGLLMRLKNVLNITFDENVPMWFLLVPVGHYEVPIGCLLNW